MGDTTQKRQKFTEQPLPQYGQQSRMPQQALGQTQPDFMGLMSMIQQGQQALLRQSQTPVSQISKDQHTQRGTPGLDQWHRNNPNAQVGLPGQNYGQSGPDVPAGPNPAMQSPQAAPDHAGGFMKVIGDGLMHLLGGGQQGGAQAPQGQNPMQGPPRSAMNAQANPQQMGPPVSAMNQQPQQQSSPQPQPFQGPMQGAQQEPPKQLQTQEGFNNPPQQGPGMGLGGLLNTATNGMSLAGAPGMAAGQVAGNLGNIATHAGNQLPQLMQGYQHALGAVSTGQKALQAGAITGGELAPAMRAASGAFNALQTGTNSASTAVNVAGRAGNVATALSGGSRLAPVMGTIGKVAAPIQAGMMLAEGGRLAFDPAFREQSARNYDSLSQKGAMAGLGQGLSAPISTIANSAGGLYDLVNNIVSDKTQRGEDAVLNQQTKTAGNTSEVSRLRAQGKSKAEIQTAMVKFRKRNSTK